MSNSQDDLAPVREYIQQFKTGQQQVDDATLVLDQKKHSGIESITSIRVNTNDNEAKRRIKEEDLKKNRLTKLQSEALMSAKANAAIEMKWAELLEKEIPQELHHEITMQMESCHSIIQSKDELILDFQSQLRLKDEEYVRTLRQHSDDIDTLLIRIRKEFLELQAEYEKQLDSIEEAYLEERERLIQEHTNEIDNMFEIRRNKESYYKEMKIKNEEQYQREVEDLIVRGADQYNKLKIELEMNIQALKQQLEEIRATYQLNTEKLDYNYRVLTELDVEKNAELARYKRRLNKLKSQLNTLITKYTEMESNDTKLNNDLTEDYRTLTLKYKDLQTKFRHFEIADTTKYDEVWAMHEEEVKDLVDQLLKADKIITEQVLGYNWKSPDMQALQQVLGRHGGLGLNSTSGKMSSEIEEESQHEASVKETNDGVEDKSKKMAGFKVRAVLKILAQEAGFMINPTIQQSIDSLPEIEADISRAENILKALGVKSEEKLNTLINYFFQEKFNSVMNIEVAVSPEKEGNHEEENEFEQELKLMLKNPTEEISVLKTMIKPEDVIAAVKAYIEDMSVEAGPVGVTSAVSGGTKLTQEEIRIAQKRLTSMKNYWITLSQIVNDDNVRVWKQLETDYMNLKEVLNKRSQAINEVDDLTARNAQLKSLLNQYLGDSVTNSAFKIPPAQVMKIRDISASASFSASNSQGGSLTLGKSHLSKSKKSQSGPSLKDYSQTR